jgi:hypothetical protein
VSSVGEGSFATSTSAPNASGVVSGTAGVGTVGDAQFTATGTGNEAASVRRATSGADVQGQVPSVSVESEVSQTAGQQGSTVLRGGGAGIVEQQAGGASTSNLEVEATAAARQGSSDARGAAGVTGQVTSFRDPSSEMARAENLELHQRDEAVAKARSAEDAHDQARRTVEDPAAVGSARAHSMASQKISESTPAGVGRAEANMNLATDAVADPQAAARNQAEAAASAQARDAEAKLGVSGSATVSTEGVSGTASKDSDKT